MTLLEHADDARASVARAVWRPRHLGVSLTALAVALAMAGLGWPAIAITLVIAGLVAHAGLASLQLVREEPSRLLQPAPAPDEIVARELRESYERIATKHEELRGSLSADSDLAIRCRELVRQAGLAAHRANPLHEYLQSASEMAIAAEATSLELRAAQVADRSAASVLTEAALAKLQQLDTRAALQGMFDRTLARLLLIEASFDAMRAKLVQIDAVTTEDASDATGDVTEQLDALATDMRLLEEAFLGDLHGVC